MIERNSSELIKSKFEAPPGGLVIWIFVLLELVTFGMFFVTFAFERHDNLELFNSSSRMLNSGLATINTLVLVTSSLLVVMGLHKLKVGDVVKSKLLYIGAATLGILFLILKVYEYSGKMSSGITMGTNSFFAYYWLLTLLHFFHVVIGVVILFYMSSSIKSGIYSAENYYDVESASIYWHLCDLLWILLFPLLYLLT